VQFQINFIDNRRNDHNVPRDTVAPVPSFSERIAFGLAPSWPAVEALHRPDDLGL
jgi:hypothetical protein